MTATTTTAGLKQQEGEVVLVRENDDIAGRSKSFRQLPPPTKKIIIVGAGAASIQLAHTLWKVSSSLSEAIEVTILEANDYIGGRVCSAKFHGHTIERGANWISGRETQTGAFDGMGENPIWTLAKQNQLEGQVSERHDAQCLHVIDATKTMTSGNEVSTTTDEYLAQVARFEGIYEKVLQEATFASQQGTVFITPQADVSVRSLLEKQGWTSKEKLSNVERAVEHNVLEVSIADTLEQLGASHDLKPGANDVDLGSDEMFVQDARGFSSIFNSLIDDLKTSTGGTMRTQILLNKQVQSIHYKPGQVKVVVKNIKSKDGARNSDDMDKRDEESEAEDEEEVYHADIVVSTVSLGVLQSGLMHFVPPLPDWKVKALNEVAMFTFAKVFCKFGSKCPWWPADKQFILFISDGESKRGHYPLWMKYKTNRTDDDASVLCMCYLGGAEAKRVESLSEEQVKDEIEELFSKAFCSGQDDDNSNITKEDCRPESVAVTDWSRNPRFCGSYSYFPVGAFASVPEADYRCGLTGLAKHDVSTRRSTSNGQGRMEEDGPMKIEREGTTKKTTLYFAGEAFDDKFNGWVQGGYLSGQRVARSILQDLQQQQRKNAKAFPTRCFNANLKNGRHFARPNTPANTTMSKYPDDTMKHCGALRLIG
jgi:polyamine oxidase